METDHLESLYIVMPAYNEEETIAEVVSKWYKVLEGKSESSRLIVADSGSTDRTHALLLEMQSRYPQLVILDGTLKQHGPKLIAMYKYAIAQGADYIFQTDSDGQTNPDEFQAFWDLRDKYDAILGNRVVRGDGKSRKFVEKFLCFLLQSGIQGRVLPGSRLLQALLQFLVLPFQFLKLVIIHDFLPVSSASFSNRLFTDSKARFTVCRKPPTFSFDAEIFRISREILDNADPKI